MKREKRSGGQRGPGPTTAIVQVRRRRLRRPQVLNAKSQIPNPNAFTLIELLVVIAVIALLMGILLPVLSRVRMQAKALACQGNLRQFGMGLYAYAAENDGEAPHIWGEDRGSASPGWEQVFLLGVDSNEVLLCPRAAKTRRDRGGRGSTFYAWKYEWRLYSSGSTRVIVGSYAWNAAVGVPAGYPVSEWPRSWRAVDVEGAAGIPFIFGCAQPYYDPEVASAPCTLGDPPNCEDSDDRSIDSRLVCMNRHDGGINMCFLDSSVRKVGLKELWTLKWHRQYDTANRWTKAGGVRPEDWPEWMRKFKDY